MLKKSFMHLGPRLVTSVGLALGLAASTAKAQPVAPPETLETPYAEAPPAPSTPATPSEPSEPSEQPVAPQAAQLTPAPASARPPPARLAASTDTRPLSPIRSRRRLSLMMELGWNGLAGFGPILTYHADPHVALDVGAGFSFTGWKAGVRARVNLLKSPLSPFVGAGFMATSGLGEVTVNPDDRSNDEPSVDPVTLNVRPSAFVQTIAGIDYVHRRGFTLLAGLGWAFLLNHNNVDVVAGSLKPDEKKAVNALFRSGAVVSFSAGYAFQ
jgi:hypothetical protein